MRLHRYAFSYSRSFTLVRQTSLPYGTRDLAFGHSTQILGHPMLRPDGLG